MTEEYLWNKTGDDPEIKKLENALGAFRYQEDLPPVLPIVETETKSNGWRFSLVFATAAFATMVIATVTWFQINKGTVDDEITFVYYPTVENTQQLKPVEEQPPIVEPQPAPKQSAPRVKPVIQSTYVSVPRPHKRTPKPKTQMVGTESLTAQERYAYNQLMLALSISSSKLKIVQDAVNGVEDTVSNKKENNR